MKQLLPISNRFSIKTKLLLSYSLLILIPLVLITGSLTFTYKKTTYEKLANQSLLSLDKYASEFADKFRAIGSVMNQLLVDKHLEALALTSYETTLQVFKAYYDYNNFKVYSKYYDEISSIRLYCYNDTILENGNFMLATKEVRATQWFQNAQKQNGRILWQYDAINSSTPSYHLTYELKGTHTKTPLGILSIELNQNYLDGLLTGAYFDTLVFDSQGDIISSSHDSSFFIEKLILPDTIHLSSDEIIDVTYQDQHAKLILKNQRMDYLNLDLVLASIIPSAFILQDTWQSLVPVLIILCMSGILAVLLILFFNQSICRRISKICRTMNEVALGNFDVPLEIDGEDEISQLYVNLRKMVRDINNLVNEVYVTNLQKQQLLIHQKDIQFQMLANQVNPHFLFNMLESIRMKAHQEGCEDLSDIIEALAFIIRRRLDKCQDLVPISYEIEILETYLKLIHFRFQDRISYTLSCPETIQSHMMPYLIIQPLVENAIIHGIEPKGTPGQIEISVSRNHDLLIIEVKDNGVGMDEVTCSKLTQSFLAQDSDSYKHIGLKNIDSRIKLIYGNAYGVSVQSTCQVGTTIHITLPINPSKGELPC